jgi:putative transposase
MTNYRRNLLAGGCFFFTVNLAERHLHLLTDHIDQLRTAFRETRRITVTVLDCTVIRNFATSLARGSFFNLV